MTSAKPEVPAGDGGPVSEQAEELRKDGERLDWASEHLLFISASGTAGLPTGWIVDEYEKDEDGFSGTTLRAALDAARGEKP